MPVNLASCLLKDFVYKQDEKTEYVIIDGKFEMVDRDAVADAILENIDRVFLEFLGSDEKYSIERTYDPFALNQAMCRYSRDIFGEYRLHARLKYLTEKSKIQDPVKDELFKYEDYGLKTDSVSPYLHRRIACMLYWFSVLKPFRAILKSSIASNDNTYAYLEYHNEWTSYLLTMMVLKCVNWRINVHDDLPYFKQFLYDLHYRKLSRSALEFFLRHHLTPIR
jgi:hypothetical protein